MNSIKKSFLFRLSLFVLFFYVALPGVQVRFQPEGKAEVFKAPPGLLLPLKFEIPASGEVLILHGRQGQQAMHYRAESGEWKQLLKAGPGPGEAVFVVSFFWKKDEKEIALFDIPTRKAVLFKQDSGGRWQVNREYRTRSFYDGLVLVPGFERQWIVSGNGSAKPLGEREADSNFSLFLVDENFEFQRGLIKAKDFYSGTRPGKKEESDAWRDIEFLFPSGFHSLRIGHRVYQVWNWSPRLIWYDLKNKESGYYYLNGSNFKPIEYSEAMVREKKKSGGEAFHQKYRSHFQKFSINYLLGGSKEHLLLLYSVKSGDEFIKKLEGVIAGHDGNIVGSGSLTLEQYEHGSLFYDGERRLLYHLYEDLEKEGRWLLQTYRLSWPGMTES